MSKLHDLTLWNNYMARKSIPSHILLKGVYMNNNYEWFTIPDFTSYEISVNTGLIRSLKHFKKDCFHIMKVDKKTG